MPTYMCAICKSKKSVYPLPKLQSIKDNWLYFINKCQPSHEIKITTGICFIHFDKSSFKNFLAWEQKISKCFKAR